MGAVSQILHFMSCRSGPAVFQGPAAGVFVQLAFPLRNHRSGDAVADHVGGSAAHVEELVDADDQQDAGFRQMEHRQDGGHHHQRTARHASHALAAHHQHQQHGELLGERHFNIVGLRHEQGGERLVHHRTVEVEGITERQHETGDLVVDAEVFQLLHGLRISRFAAGGGKRQHDRLFQQAQQGEDRTAQEDVADGDQQRPQGRQPGVETAEELGVGGQHAEALHRDDGGDGGKYAERRKAHHVIGHFQHHVHQAVDGVGDGLAGLALDRRQAEPEKQREHKDLQDFILRHGVDEAAREHMRNKILQVEAAGIEFGVCSYRRQRQVERMADLQHVDKQHAQRQRQQRSNHEPAEGADADAAHRAAVLHAGDARHQGAEHQRCNDHLDQAQEYIGDDGEVAGDFFCRGFIRRQVVADIADHDPEDHADHDPSRCFNFFHLRIRPLDIQKYKKYKNCRPGLCRHREEMAIDAINRTLRKYQRSTGKIKKPSLLKA
ncbi:hypothetical protein CFU_0690 [Collimonas fungivorans Ter331]|uniref:Uncharacterized protein n=1 Tax=Collimonas fungivorans (strain Ter331) TaxID=1005048 RepID=G0AEZ8_COLFT|nr:hypothetical protein CFU_0690 [Collimonas fungivorans Ter331]